MSDTSTETYESLSSEHSSESCFFKNVNIQTWLHGNSCFSQTDLKTSCDNGNMNEKTKKLNMSQKDGDSRGLIPVGSSSQCSDVATVNLPVLPMIDELQATVSWGERKSFVGMYGFQKLQIIEFQKDDFGGTIADAVLSRVGNHSNVQRLIYYWRVGGKEYRGFEYCDTSLYNYLMELQMKPESNMPVIFFEKIRELLDGMAQIHGNGFGKYVVVLFL